jgi:hypothetical protein
MPISFVAAGTVAAGTNPTVTVPAGYQQGDLLLIVTAGTATPATPSGWTQVSFQLAGQFITILRKFATGSEASVTLTVTGATTRAVMVAYRGVSATDTLSATYATGTGTTVTPNTLTASFANEYIISIYAGANTASNWTANGSTTERVNSSSTAALRGLLIADELQAAAGTSTARAATLSVSNTWAAIALSIIPSGRYWVGGTGTWASSTTNWSFSSGGANGAPVPTPQDDVFFDQSGTYTVTITGNGTCFNFTTSNASGTITFALGTTPALAISGSIQMSGIGLNAGTFPTFTLNATSTGRTITTNGFIFSNAWTFNGVGGYWTLGSNFSSGSTSTVTVTAGTFDTGSQTVSVYDLVSSGALVRSILLNNSTFTIRNNLNISSVSTNLTFNAGTSQINFSGGTIVTITSPNLTFWNVSFTGTGISNLNINGTNTFNNLSFNGPISNGWLPVVFGATQTVNGIFSTASTQGNRRVFFRSSAYGQTRTLNINGTSSVTDADFRDIYVRGATGSISGTRIGNCGQCTNISFSAPKTVYWRTNASTVYTGDNWATAVGGATSTNNFPLPQDTAVFVNTGLSSGGTITVSGNGTAGEGFPYIGSIDMSGRTLGMTLAFSTNFVTVYGTWKNSNSVTITGTGGITFAGSGSITSAGRSFPMAITVDAYGGIVSLVDAGSFTTSFTVANGTFQLNNQTLTTPIFSSSGTTPKTISLGSGTLSISTQLGGFSGGTTFDAGTSQINLTGTPSSIQGGGISFYNVTFSGSSGSLGGAGALPNTFQNLTFSPPASAGIRAFTINSDQIITGTLNLSSATITQRSFIQSSSVGVPVTLTVGTLSATNADFRDITIAGTAAGSSPSQAGNCGGNTGITFPAPKTVYWNLAGSQNWSANGWALTSGGTPAVNNFPLAQDTFIANNTNPNGTITINANWNIGTIDWSTRTSLFLNLAVGSNSPNIYGDCYRGTGVNGLFTGIGDSGSVIFSGSQTQTYSNNSGIIIYTDFIVNKPVGSILQLGEKMNHFGSNSFFSVIKGVFDAVTYDCTTASFNFSGTETKTVKMGTGLWTIFGSLNGFDLSATTNSTLNQGTANIIFTGTSAVPFAGGGFSFNKLTLPATGSALISGSNSFTEIAKSGTGAFTLTFTSSTNTTVGKWSVTGSLGNVVTVNSSVAASAFTISIAGPANSGIDYLSVRDCTVATTSPGEFYVGANSTNVSGNTRVIFTATPAPRTLYWVGGTGNWSSTTKWSTSSGGGSGAAIPTSLDAVNFDSLSNATAYTATIDAGVPLARCASFTMAGPLSGNVTFAGTVGIAFHGNVSFAATGITRTYTGDMNWAGNSSYTFTTNGLSQASTTTVTGIGATWTLGSNFLNGASFIVLYGTFTTNNNQLNCGIFNISNNNTRTVNLGSSTVNIGTSITLTNSNALTFNAGTSTINFTNFSNLGASGQTFYDVNFSRSTVGQTGTISGSNTFNTLTINGPSGVGINTIIFSDNQTIGTLVVQSITNVDYRTFFRSSVIGTTRTLNISSIDISSVRGRNIDFRDIAITGTAAGTSLPASGNCGNNSGIVFPAAKTVYWNLTGSQTWNLGWALTSGGSPTANNIPLAQDTAVFDNAGAAGTVTINTAWNIGTLDASARTSAMTLASSTNTPTIYGDCRFGTGLTISGTGAITFAGTGSQEIQSNGRTFTQPLSITKPSGTLTLSDSLTVSNSFTILQGTFTVGIYNVTISSFLSNSSVAARTVNMGSGTWTLSGTGTIWDDVAYVGNKLTLNKETANILLSSTSTATRTLNFGRKTLNKLTIGGATGTSTTNINDAVEFSELSSTKTVAHTVFFDSLGANAPFNIGAWSIAGSSGNVVTVNGSTSASLVYTGATYIETDWLSVGTVKGYTLYNRWYVGSNSINNGSLGMVFTPFPQNYGRFFLMFG